MGLKKNVQDQVTILENLNKDFFPTQVNGAITALAAYIAEVDNVTLANGTINSVSAVTVNGEAGILSVSGSFTQTLTPLATQSFIFNMTNSYVTSTTPIFWNVNTSAGLAQYSVAAWNQLADGSVTGWIVNNTAGVTGAVSALTIHYRIITPRTSGD